MNHNILKPSVIECAIQKALIPFAHYKRVVVALSGGIDSVVLLHALSCIKPDQVVIALHVNHGLSPHANQWEQHCSTLCEQLKVSFKAIKVDVSDAGKGIEAAARDARLAAFARVVDENTLLLTGHHLADQAETFLHRLCRGSGLQGLQGMLHSRPLTNTQANTSQCGSTALPLAKKAQQGILVRPLLNIPKQPIIDYAQAYSLAYVNDESNTNTRFTRNFLRQSIIGRLKQKWPQVEQNIARAALHIQDSQALLDTYLHTDFITLDPLKTLFGHSIQLDVLQAMPAIKQTHLMRYWLGSLGLPMPSHAQLHEVHKLILAKIDACPEVRTHYYSIRRFQNRLVCLRVLPAIDANTVLSWDVSLSGLPDSSEASSLDASSGVKLTLPDGSTLIWCGQGKITPNSPLTVRFRQGGERCKPLGRKHSQTLKKLFQEYGIAPWLRERIPLIYLDDQLLAVGDAWVCVHPAINNITVNTASSAKGSAYKIVQWRD